MIEDITAKLGENRLIRKNTGWQGGVLFMNEVRNTTFCLGQDKLYAEPVKRIAATPIGQGSL
jgi:hypothetical protein